MVVLTLNRMGLTPAGAESSGNPCGEGRETEITPLTCSGPPLALFLVSTNSMVLVSDVRLVLGSHTGAGPTLRPAARQREQYYSVCAPPRTAVSRQGTSSTPLRLTEAVEQTEVRGGFLFHSVCSSDGQGATSVTKNVAAVTTAPSVVPTGGSASSAAPTIDSKPKTGATAGGTTGAPPSTTKNEPTQATSAKPTAAVTVPANPVTATSKPTDNPAPTNPQAPTVTNNPPAPSISISGASPAAATPGLPKAMTTAATADSSGSSVVSRNAATPQTPETSVPSKTSGTKAPVGLPTPDTPTPRQQSMTHTTATSETSQENTKGGTEQVTATVTSPQRTASRAQEPAGNTGTTGTHSSHLTMAGTLASATEAGTTSPQTAAAATTTTATTTTSAAAQPKTFSYSLNNGHEKEEEKDLVEVCRRLMANLQDGNCTLTWRHHNGKIQFDCVEINGKVKTSLATQYYEEITKKPTDNKTLIAILASCGALLIMIVILAVCASHHRKPYNENQQHLTEELHTVENGYHDNPTLEVMEVQPEMQEKKMALNGEFNDSWIVPIDNLLKEDIPDEEDTHL
ncbi:podocalyxin [Enoplosus armatus]|uniref:podocalyxin n=1 Tax=Enoplosus armatus TaxID=215367 RepID=UPI003996963B